MPFLRKLRPYILGGLIAGGGMYAKNEMENVPEAPIEIVEESTVELINVRSCPHVPAPIIQSCPPVPICPPPQVKIVKVPAKPIPGCYVNWKSGEASGFTTKGKSLRCTINYIKKTVNTEFSTKGFYVRQQTAFKRLQ